MTRRSSFFPIHLAALALTSSLLIPRSSWAQPIQIFVSIEQTPGNFILGESVAQNHVGWIEAHGVGSMVNQPPSAPASFSDVSILKSVDRATPRLFLVSAMGTHLQNVTIHFVRSASNGDPFFSLKLESVLISSVRTTANPNEGISEFVTFKFGKIVWTYRPTNPDTGLPGPPLIACWDLEAGVAC